jgi:4-hydroxybenzoate polyprenyltransferase
MPQLMKAFALQLKSRKTEIFMWCWATAVGCLVAGKGNPPILSTIMISTAMLLMATSVYTYNDITDTELDKLNQVKKERAVPSGKITMNQAKTIVYTTGFAGMILGLLTNFTSFFVMALWTALFLAYSNPQMRLKKRLLLKEGTVGVGFFMTTIAGAMAVGSVSPSVIFAGVFFAFFVFLGFPAFRDTTDVYEDKLYGVKSLAILLSWRAKLELVFLFILAVMTLTPLTYVQFNLNVIFPIVTVASCFLVLRALFPLLSKFEEKKYKRAYNSLFGFFVVSQAALIFATIPFVF